MKSTLQFLAKLWLVFFGVAATFAFFFSDAVEAHQLNRTLLFGFDAFGRSCILLTLDVAFRSFSVVFPVSIACVLLSLIFSFVGMSKNSTFRFVWDAMIDTLSSLPSFLIALSLSVLFGNQWFTFILASLLLIIPFLIRFFESQIRHLSTQEFVAGAYALGGTRIHVFVRHFLPPLLHSILSVFPFLLTRL